jgi:hypothetical protein
MRLLAIILSIYTISLSALPCDDMLIVDNQQSISISQDLDNHSHNLLDLCSPFCVCNCCSSNTIEPIHHYKERITEISIKEVGTHFDISFFNNYPSQIYQPPQV